MVAGNQVNPEVHAKELRVCKLGRVHTMQQREAMDWIQDQQHRWIFRRQRHIQNSETG